MITAQQPERHKLVQEPDSILFVEYAVRGEEFFFCVCVGLAMGGGRDSMLLLLLTVVHRSLWK